MTNLEEDILKIIEDETGCKYIGKLKVVKSFDMYELLLHMNQEQAPLHLGYQGDEEGFKNFIKEEMHFRKNNDVKFWKALRESIYDLPGFENNIITL